MNLTTSGGSGTGEVTYVVNSGSCTIAGSVLTPTGAGSCSVTATKAASSGYPLAISSSPTTITISKANPSITLSVTNSPVTYDTTAKSATVTSSGTAGVVSNILTGGSATQTNAGTYAVTATFTPTDTTNYNTLTGVSAGNFIINKATPTLSVTNSPVTYNGSPRVATVTGSVAGTISDIKYDGSTTAPANAGTYTITADFVPTDTTNYNNLSDASAGSFVINTISQTASITNTPTPFTGLLQTATISCSGGGVPTITSGGTGTNAGSYATTVTCSANGNYALTTGINAGDFVISKINQSTLTVTAQTITYPASFVALTTTGGLGTGAVSYAIASSGTAGCSVSGTTLTYANAGTCTVTATKAGDTNYNATTSTAQTFTVNLGTQSSLTFTGQTITLGDSFATLTASGGTGTGSITFAVTTPGTAGCTITEGTMLNYATAGACIVTATKDGGVNYNDVSSSATFVVNSIFTQSNYRLFKNLNGLNVGDDLALENTPALLETSNNPFRLRMLLGVNGSILQNSQSFKLQYSEKNGTCDPLFDGEVYKDVTRYSDIAYYNNHYPDDKTQLISNPNDPSVISSSIFNQSYVESNNFSNNFSAITTNNYGMWDFSLYDKITSSGASYCFRIVKSDNSLLNNYQYIPEITTATYNDRYGGDDVSSSTSSGGNTTDGNSRYGGDEIDGSGSTSGTTNSGGNYGGGGDLE